MINMLISELFPTILPPSFLLSVSLVYTHAQFASWSDWLIEELFTEFLLVFLGRLQLILHLLHFFVHFYRDLEIREGRLYYTMCHHERRWTLWHVVSELWFSLCSVNIYSKMLLVNGGKEILTSLAKLTSFSSIFTFSALSTSPSPTCSSFSFSSVSILSRSNCRSSHAQDRALGCPT